jgi:hypothetical protein
MRMTRWIVLALLLAGLALTGCYYKRPDVEGMFAATSVGMTKDEVIEALKHPPTVVEDNQLLYLYDDPLNPVRLRYVLNEQDVVVEKYLETKQELAKKAQEQAASEQPIKPLAGEETRTYPGGPLPRFEKKPGVGGY